MESLVQEAFQQRPELEQAVLAVKKDEITLKGARNALLPTLDVYGFYQGTGEAELKARMQHCPPTGSSFAPCPRTHFPPVSYGTRWTNAGE
jgi:outer membrane protein